MGALSEQELAAFSADFNKNDILYDNQIYVDGNSS